MERFLVLRGRERVGASDSLLDVVAVAVVVGAGFEEVLPMEKEGEQEG